MMRIAGRAHALRRWAYEPSARPACRSSRRSTQRAYRMAIPSSQARRPKALRMWLLPVPLMPVMMRSSRRPTKSSLASSTTKALSSLGWKSHSKAWRVFRSTRPLALTRYPMRFSSLCAASLPRTCSRRAVLPGLSRVAHASRSSRSARVRVRRSSSRCRRSRSRTSLSSPGRRSSPSPLLSRLDMGLSPQGWVAWTRGKTRPAGGRTR